MQDNQDTRGIFNPGHYWGKATSNNLNDPTLIYDPLKDKFKIDYTGCKCQQ